MKLFTLGPVTMYEESKLIGGQQVPYFRNKDFSDIMLENEVLLKTLLAAGEEDKEIFLTASGTGAMEACVLNGLTRRDKVLIINSGTFGERFVRICALHGIAYIEIKIMGDQEFESECLESYASGGYSALMVNMHETSNGRWFPIEQIGEFCKRNHLYLIVDGIGSFLADECYFRKWGIDIFICSSQKGLALAPGMSFVTISSRFYQERIKSQLSESFYFDFQDHIENQSRGQTPFTPAVRLLIELNNRLKQLCRIGITKETEKCRMLAEGFRSMIREQGIIQIPGYRLSNALTPLCFKKDAMRIYRELRDRYGMEVNPCGGENADRMLRVGHLGNVFLEDYKELVHNLKEIMEQE